MCDKKIASTAHIMRDKRVISFIQYVVGAKKTANTPPYINPGVNKKSLLFGFVVLTFVTFLRFHVCIG